VNCSSVVSTVLAGIVILSMPHPAAAQGNSQNKGRGVRPPAPSPPAAVQPVPPSGAGIRNFGAWLDDSSVVAPHSGWAGFSIGYWKSPFGRQFDVPSADLGYGLSPRVQVGFTMPYYRSRYGGVAAAGLGDA
jgi:hypothetical protein